MGKEESKLPEHIAIIPDGNRRWAKQRGLPAKLGHQQGANAFKKVVRLAGNLGIKYLSFYAFSTENWKRSDEEVNSLMDLLLSFLKHSDEELGEDKERIRIIVTGEKSGLSTILQEEIERVTNETKDNKGITVNICINYGSRDEIVRAVRKICSMGLKEEEILESTISSNLYNKDLPDPDLLIRTSGEVRISNFMLWQLAYTELYFTKKYWPDFGKRELNKAIKSYQKRQRRYGAN